MTIAVCYVSPEGVVLGADSTASVPAAIPALGSGAAASGFHYFNHNQKIFQIGEESSLGIATWGLGGIGSLSYRTLIARFADQIQSSQKATTVEQISIKWAQFFHDEYKKFIASHALFQALNKKTPFTPGASTDPESSRTEQEEKIFAGLRSDLCVGFYLGGYCLPTRIPEAYEINFDPLNSAAPTPERVVVPSGQGARNLIKRLIRGYDDGVRSAILGSEKWTGDASELDKLLGAFEIAPGAILPIRDAVDFVYMCIFCTIKAMKFSKLHQFCGGPIELAVITSDRKFRWVRHKQWDAAITEGDGSWRKFQ